jgi:hypothetical protein
MASNRVKTLVGRTLAALIALTFAPAYAQTDFELLGSRTYTDSAGNYHIVGEVKNITNRTWRFVEVTVPLIDAEERVIAAPTTFLFVEFLRPGESGAFHILRSNATQFEGALAYAVHLNYIIADLPEGALEVVVEDVVLGAGGDARIIGEVENLGNTAATQVQVSAALYDADDNLIDTTVGFTGDIPAGESAPFALVSAVSGAREFDRMSLNVQSREYVMVPEFPIPTLALLVGLAVVIAFAQRRGYLSSIFPR